MNNKNFYQHCLSAAILLLFSVSFSQGQTVNLSGNQSINGFKRFNSGLFFGIDSSAQLPLGTDKPYTRFGIVYDPATNSELPSSFTPTTYAFNDQGLTTIVAYDGAGGEPRFTLNKARGTLTNPLSVQTGDVLGRIMFRPFQGSEYLPSISLMSFMTGSTDNMYTNANLTFNIRKNGNNNPHFLDNFLELHPNGNIYLPQVPPNVSGSSEILTRNTQTGAIEKFPENSKMSLNPNGGNVSIGGAPALYDRLQVAGSVNAYNGYSLGSSAEWGMQMIDSNYEIKGGIGKVNRLTIKSDGNVGIGTTNPTVKLDVIGDINSYKSRARIFTFLDFNGSGEHTNVLYAPSITRDIEFRRALDNMTNYPTDLVWSRATGVFDFKQTPTINGVQIQQSLGYTPYNPASYPINLGGETLQSVTDRGNLAGNIKLLGGSDNSNFELASDVLAIKRSSGRPHISFHNNAGLRLGFFQIAESDDVYITNMQNNGISFMTNGLQNRMKISADGNVLISTITDNGTDKLQVNGNIKAKAVKVDPNAWPDYVFEANYPLLSLKDTETFIQKNKHLPEVPSASEVAEKGHDLGEMNTILLKKVEELTLHLIALKKNYEELKSELDKLKPVHDDKNKQP